MIRGYDEWKLATPPEHDEPASEEPAELEADESDESGDDDYSWEREPLCNLIDNEVE